MSNISNEREVNTAPLEQESTAANFEENYIDETIQADSSNKVKEFIKKFMKRKTAVVAFIIMVFLLIIALIGPYIAPCDPKAFDYDNILAPPSAQHWFGTEFYGRDIFSRVIWGTRIDLMIGVLGVIIPFLVGGIIGLLAGYYGGALDSLLMRVTDIMMAFPFTILVITIMAILGQGIINLFIALWLVGWMSYAKLVRSEVLVLKNSEFIQAAQVAGFSDIRILFRHLMPNVISSAVVFAASDVVMCMLTGASMSFLGLGVSPPTPEWGAILNEGRTFITFAWWQTFFPGLFLAISGVGFSLLGDSLTDFLHLHISDILLTLYVKRREALLPGQFPEHFLRTDEGICREIQDIRHTLYDA